MDLHQGGEKGGRTCQSFTIHQLNADDSYELYKVIKTPIWKHPVVWIDLKRIKIVQINLRCLKLVEVGLKDKGSPSGSALGMEERTKGILSEL